MQKAKLALALGQPVLAYRYREPGQEAFQVRRARYAGGAWQREIIYNGPTYPAVGVSHDGSTARVYYARQAGGGTAYVAESGGGGVWEHTELAPGRPVQRLAVTMRADGADLAYLVAPFAVSDRRGELYFRTVAR